MKIRSNFWLVAAAVLVGLYTWWLERPKGRSVIDANGDTARFAPIPAQEFVELELSVSNRLMVLQRATATAPWSLKLPVVGPVEKESVKTWLRELEGLRPTAYIGPVELGAAGGSRAFGLAPETATRVSGKTADGSPFIFLLGASAPGGSRFYFQRVGDPGVFVADPKLLQTLPASVDDWRERSLLTPPRDGFDRLEVRGVADFRAERDASGFWQLKRPLDARADTERINLLLAQLAQVSVGQFVADGSVADLETYGLQKPALEITLGKGAQDLVQLQFGNVVSNEPSQRYVWRRMTTNLATVPTAAVEPWVLPLVDFRNRRLMPDVARATALEFTGPAGHHYRVERTNQLSTNWWVTAPRRFRADTEVMAHFLNNFGLFEIVDFPADVVTDLARYGLAPPSRSYRLEAGTNLLCQLLLGTAVPQQPLLLYARRTDEPSVYTLPSGILGQVANSETALRDWRFASTNVARLLVQTGTTNSAFVRTNGGWLGPRGRLDGIASGNLDATLSGLSKLRCHRVAVLDAKEELQLRATYRMAAVSFSVTVEMQPIGPETFSRWTLEFGSELGADRVALARFDDDPTPLRLTVPIALFDYLTRDLRR